ncbi:glycine betaine ABC transporter ATP-binding protein [Marinitenerispora sediminis]|uniref:Glycine betaine ABC transporter ATP-binding protein n=1 Tax=Marinitenerispora sediminis TaxID=1931232 RepID=A0A368T4A9_9ACTN|nr:glycine betaine ABC transporter ATP-binding protein [Marinitenerispora sediminis]RCV53333.1 glycine betaine ABC transporter ATP-binding protein [Marinitenerispora sediminis]RCV57547.1 glycine betaine ABC transporter ATP-binding protein [Marinitenerispora sediminis]
MFGKRASRAVELLSDGRHRDEIRQLNVTAAVIDVSFEVRAGEIFVVMGLSGSGKSTLIRMLNGLLEPTSGTVEIDGTDITRLSGAALRQVRSRKISMVFQHFALFPHRSVLENAAYGLEVRGVPREERLEKARHSLGLVGLAGWEDRLPQQLSGGMQQRVGLARALAADTDIILMDEAFSALDPLIRRDMQTQLLELQASLGKTIVFITHDLNEAMRLGDRICVLRDGRVAQIGTAEEILNDPANDYVAQFVEDVDRTRVLTASSVMEPPIPVIDPGHGPRTALRTMRENQTVSAFVVRRNRQLVGAVREDAIGEAVRTGATDLAGLVDTAVERVHPDTAVADLFHQAAESPYPLAVVDDDGRLVGVIPRVTLLAALAPPSTESPEPAESPEAPESPEPAESPEDADQATSPPASGALAGSDEGSRQ